MSGAVYDHHSEMSLSRALSIYENLRPYKPAAAPRVSEYTDRLTDILDHFDALLLDGYGVLNVGANPVPGAGDMLRLAKEKNVEILVLTNGASKPSHIASAKYKGFGFDIPPSHVVSSRDALIDYLEKGNLKSCKLGVVDSFTELQSVGDIELIPLSPQRPQDWTNVDAIGFFGAVHWTPDWQACLEHALMNGIDIFVANPDVTAPTEGGFTFEPGYWASAAAHHTGAFDHVKWFGKPHAPVFDLALKRLEANTGRANWDYDRIAMVGDSLHTDILGGQAAGLKTVLITGYGLFRDGSFDAAIATTGIHPDFIAEKI